jgi:hypothetical protein
MDFGPIRLSPLHQGSPGGPPMPGAGSPFHGAHASPWSHRPHESHGYYLPHTSPYTPSAKILLDRLLNVCHILSHVSCSGPPFASSARLASATSGPTVPNATTPAGRCFTGAHSSEVRDVRDLAQPCAAAMRYCAMLCIRCVALPMSGHPIPDAQIFITPPATRPPPHQTQPASTAPSRT